jgi:citrate synthase
MEDSCKPAINTGLRGVTIASTKISDVDGKAGRLIYRGYLVGDLAERTSFEEVAHLLLFEKLPGREALKNFSQRIAAERTLPEGVIAAMRQLPADALPMDVLQATVPMLAAYDPDIRDRSREASVRMAIRLIAKFPTIVAAWERIRNGLEPVAPDPRSNQAANFLHMLKGEPPDPEMARFFDTALVLHAEHSFNASTFAAREVASTRAHMYAAVSAAVGSLSGELHGGANVRVMEMLKKIGKVENVEAFVEQEFDAGRVLFGLGHAVYGVDDPRALILAPMSKRAGEMVGDTQWFAISQRLAEAGKKSFRRRKNRDIFLNVDFYSASLYNAMGIPTDLFTPVFAISRIAGWSTHVLEEQYADAAPKPMLYRPESDYVGDYCGPEECTWVPIEAR